MKYMFNKSVTWIHNKDRIVLFNHEEGTWINLHENVLNNICWYLDHNIDVDDRLGKLFGTLIENKIIIEMVSIKPVIENVTIMLTKKCNLSCKHCCASELQLCSKDISEEVLKKIIDLKPMQITLSGGEALLHPDFKEIVQMLRENYDGLITLASNGLLIGENIELIDKYIDKVEISLDGYNEYIVGKYRDAGVYNRVIDAVTKLKSINKRTAMSMVTHDTSNDYTKNFNELNERYGTVPIIRSLHINEKVIKNIDELVEGGLKTYLCVRKREILDSKLKAGRCGMIRYQIFVDTEGYVYPCGGLAEDQFRIGNIDDQQLCYDISFNPHKYYNKIINRMLDQDVFSRCRDCCVRPFCWNCMGEVISVSKIKELFDFYCETRYERWNNIVWSNGDNAT